MVSVLAGLILFITQDKVKAAFNDKRVVARFYAIPWYPLTGVVPGTTLPGRSDLKMGHLNKPSGEAFPIVFNQSEENAEKLVITNQTGKEVPWLEIDVRGLGLPTDAVIVRRSGTDKDHFLPKVTTFRTEALGPGDVRVVYLWSGADFGNDYSAEKIKLYSPEGEIKPLRLHFPRSDDDFIARSRQVILWVVFVLCALASVLMYLVARLYERYYRRLLESDDFYLEEKLRRDANPSSFTPKVS